jgi:two-component system nitrogen regulation sensor histidine kinase GlnL
VTAAAPIRSGIPDARKQLASLPLAVILLAPGMRIATANPLAEQFFGQGARLLARHALADVMTFEDARMPDRIAAAEAPLSVREAAVVVRGLGPRSIDITTAPVADCPGWQLMTIQDNAAFEALGEDSGGSDNLFLRGPEILAHEIRNPLAGIRGAAQLLARKLDAKDRPLTDLITAEVDRVAGLIERMQMLSGRTVPKVVACNLHEIVRRAIAVIEAGSLPGQPDVVIREEFDPSLPPVLGEPDGLVQVLLNLLANAREACAGMPDARIWVRTRFSSGLQLQVGEDRDPVRLPIEIRISDNGPGVAASLREHLFEPFVTTKKSGHGLGLAVVRKLVSDMNGRISHDRDEALGVTHFRIHLPMARERRRADRKEESLP